MDNIINEKIIIPLIENFLMLYRKAKVAIPTNAVLFDNLDIPIEQINIKTNRAEFWNVLTKLLPYKFNGFLIFWVDMGKIKQNSDAKTISVALVEVSTDPILSNPKPYHSMLNFTSPS